MPNIESNMNPDAARGWFESSPNVRLMKADLGAYIVAFLHRAFKSSAAIVIGLSDLKTMLAAFQEEIHEAEPTKMIGTPETYLTQWSEAGWLLRFITADSSEPQYQLTRFSEDVISFVDDALTRETRVVGTESRLRMVMETFADIVRGASADPERRLASLRDERAKIDAEIAAIESGKSISVYGDAQIRERFQTAIDLLTALQSDFRAVEERFQDIAGVVQQQQTHSDGSRGEILGKAMDAEDLLRQADEGISFYAFVSFLFSPSQQSALRESIEELQQLQALVDQTPQLARVRTMVPRLLAEAEKVMRTTGRLSATLRRLLDTRASEHRVRLANVIGDIRDAAMKLRGNATEVPQWCVETLLEIQTPFARTFWTAPELFSANTPVPHAFNELRTQELAAAIAKLNQLDFKKLRGRIAEATSEGNRVTIGQLMEAPDSKDGVVELLGLVQIAHDDGHMIDRLQSQVVAAWCEEGDQMQQFTLPLVTFIPKAKTRELGRSPR